MANGGPWYGFEGESATALHLVEYDQATGNGIERETIGRALRRAYETGAESMRERAAAEIVSIIWQSGLPVDASNPRGDAAIAAALMRIQGALRALSLTDATESEER